jgi:hypothetical protein
VQLSHLGQVVFDWPDVPLCYSSLRKEGGKPWDRQPSAQLQSLLP